jgi:hypothetical protein
MREGGSESMSNPQDNIFTCPSCGVKLQVYLPTPKEQLKTRTLQEIQALFPVDLRDKLNFQESEQHVIMKTKQFLGSQDFARIAAIVRGAGGEYISAGKESHFRIPRTAP